jgi:hypothetical protein
MLKQSLFALLMCGTSFTVDKLPPKSMVVVAYEWKVGIVQRCDIQPFETPQTPLLICGKQIRGEWNDMNDLGRRVALRTSSQTMTVTFPNPRVQLKLELLEDPRVDSSNAHLAPLACVRTKTGLTCR